jgi:hypothetical protein
LGFSDDWLRNVGNADDEFAVEVHPGGFLMVMSADL